MELSSITPGPTALRALAHPVRLRILGLLRSEGPSTASALATRLGLNSGATSYHLRQLAQHGFVVDDPDRGNARERWWRAAHQATRTSAELEDSQDSREATDALIQAVAVVNTERLQRAIEERPLLPPAWRRVSRPNDWGLRLTPERAEELVRAITELVEGWSEDPADAGGAAQFVVAINTYPSPGRLAEGEPS